MGIHLKILIGLSGPEISLSAIVNNRTPQCKKIPVSANSFFKNQDSNGIAPRRRYVHECHPVGIDSRQPQPMKVDEEVAQMPPNWRRSRLSLQIHPRSLGPQLLQ
jgi:hypothetical protein